MYGETSASELTRGAVTRARNVDPGFPHECGVPVVEVVEVGAVGGDGAMGAVGCRRVPSLAVGSIGDTVVAVEAS